MNYIVRTVNDWTRPYDWATGNGPAVTERNTTETATDDPGLVPMLVNDWLDAPDKPFTEADAAREFGCETRRIDGKFAKAISRYYEWRRALMGRIKADLDRENASGRAQWILKYDVPYEYNHFETDEDGEKRALKERQNESYVEIEAWR